MTNRRYRVLGSITALLIAPAMLMVFAFGLPPQYHHTFLGELPYKIKALAQAQGKRVVLAGGSGMAFGVRSDLLEQELPGFTVVNLGMYAGLGSTIMLDLAKPYLRTGDVIIFSPEQSRQTLSLYFNAEAMWQAADGNWWLLKTMGQAEQLALLGQFPYFAARKARLVRDATPPGVEGIYAQSSFNAWGDIDSPLREQNIMNDGFDPNLLISFDPQLPTQAFVDYVNAYAAMCQKKGVAFYYRFCPMNALAVSGSEQERMADYQAALEHRLTCRLLGGAEQSVLEGAWFYDTNFHLNSAGAVVNTARLASELNAALCVHSTVSIPLPTPPPMATLTSVRGNDTDAECFYYTKTTNGYRLTGLTDIGKDRRTLTLPAQYRGETVTGFAPAVFTQNTKVEKIVIQSGMKAIEDGSFAGCAALKRIVVDNASPSSCTVGEGLLTGTDAMVVVPQKSLGAYQTNYFWSIHAARILGDSALQGNTATAAVTPAPSAERAAATVNRSNGLIRYEGNGGFLQDGNTVMDAPLNQSHLRINTLQGSKLFYRHGYVLIGWNTAANGSGAAVGLGGRIAAQANRTLYAQWLRENPTSDFQWTVQNDQVWITGYAGTGTLCVIPNAIRGLPVRRVCAGALRDANIRTLVLPDSLYTVEDQAFAGSSVQEVYLFDSLVSISDGSFSGCNRLTTLHINAAVAPVYSASYYATFADKFDWLISLAKSRKLVLFSGSSTRYGFDSAMLRQAFPDYQVANMGVYAYSNALPQLELIRAHMKPGDVLLHSPEFDTLHNQFCGESLLDEHFWAMMEANYDMASELNLRDYTHVFDSLCVYLNLRANMPKQSYAITPAEYDDDGNHYLLPTYNQYGDFILPRPNGKVDGLLQHMRANYTTAPFTQERLQGLNREYLRFLDEGISVYFTYSPRNRSSLTPESTPQARAALDKLLRESLCVPVITDIESSLYSGVYFYIVDSHLSNEGVRYRTRHVIHDLWPWLTDGCTQ